MHDTLEVLMKARAEVEKGWCYGWGDRPGRVCVLGACELVTGEDVFVGSTLYDVLLEARPHGERVAIGVYSDKGREFALELFDRAIAAEAVKASPDPSHVYAVA